MDLVWGALKRFAPRQVLGQPNIFCVRKEYVSVVVVLR
jgi:hypothetical protein